MISKEQTNSIRFTFHFSSQIANGILKVLHFFPTHTFWKCLCFFRYFSLNKKKTTLKKHRVWALAHVYYESPLAVYSHTIFSSCIFLSLWNLVRSIRMYLHFYLLNAAVKRSNNNLWRWIYCLNGPFFGIKWRNSFNGRKI